MSRGRVIFRGAIEGLLAWLAYWSVESFLLHVLPRLGEPDYLYMPPHAGFTALLLVLYGLLGAAVGVVAGFMISMLAPPSRGKTDEFVLLRLRSAATLVLCAVVLWSLLAHLPSALPSWYVLLLFSPVGFSLFAGVFSAHGARRLRLIASPWTGSIVLLAIPTVFARSHEAPTLLRASIMVLLVGALALGLAWLNPAAASIRRAFAPGALLAMLVLIASVALHQTARESGGSAVSPPPDKPNIILITLDTVRADHLSLYGYSRDTTPNLRRLAEQATVYNNAIAPGDMTLSSHASIFTGLDPSMHRAHFEPGYAWGRPLDNKAQTLSEILQAHGYDTAAIVANYLYLAPGFGLDRGFVYHDSAAPSVFLGKTEAYLLRERLRNVLTRFEKPWQYDTVFRRAGEINRGAVSYFDREKRSGRRFFCFLNYMDAHWPYLPPGRFATLYPGYDPTIPTQHYVGMERDILTSQRPISDREKNHLISQYDGGIAYMDAELGSFVEHLKQDGLFENTLLIIAGDHGEALGEKGLVGHALSVYQDMVHVPLLIKFPGQRRPAVHDEFVSLTDLMPTILTIAGYAAPAGIQGRDLSQPAVERRGSIISESFVHPMISTWTRRFQRSEEAIFSGPLKLIRSSDGNLELYDLAQDPDEKYNLNGQRDAGDLESKLVGYLRAAAIENRRQAPARTSRENLEKLKSLGYIGGN